MRIVGMAMAGFGALLLYWIYIDRPAAAEAPSPPQSRGSVEPSPYA